MNPTSLDALDRIDALDNEYVAFANIVKDFPTKKRSNGYSDKRIK